MDRLATSMMKNRMNGISLGVLMWFDWRIGKQLLGCSSSVRAKCVVGLMGEQLISRVVDDLSVGFESQLS